jgi:hypothetical protein
MAELRITWGDGRTEIRSLLPGQCVTVGNGWEPMTVPEMPIGGTICFGRKRVPYCRIRVHGNEIPAIVLVSRKSGHEMQLPSPLSLRKKRSMVG